MNRIINIFVSIALVVLAPTAFATPPKTINYQGYLTNPGGTPVNGSVSMTFRLYNAASGGTLLSSELQSSVTVANGIFNAVIGAVTPLTLAFDIPYWLTVAINTDGEMSPRQPLASSPYAFRAASLDSAATIAGSQITGAITGATITGSQITGNINATGNVLLPDSTPSVGIINKAGIRFIHNFGTDNTFVGKNAGNFAMSGVGGNTAIGAQALFANINGFANTAIGRISLRANTTGVGNISIGDGAMAANTTGSSNTAVGEGALQSNMGGINNTVVGSSALPSSTGNNNTALGSGAGGIISSGSNNIAIGVNAGSSITTGVNNIAIGNSGAAENSTIRIGDTFQTRTFIAGIRGVTTGGMVSAIPVLIDGTGQLGTISSSRRFKDNIAGMNETSSALMNLRPVTFHYKTDQNPAGRTLQYGLIAEEVNEVYPGLVAHAVDGQIETVMYQYLPPMLLNELQKQQRTIAAQAARLETLAHELREIKALLGVQ